MLQVIIARPKVALKTDHVLRSQFSYFVLMKADNIRDKFCANYHIFSNIKAYSWLGIGDIDYLYESTC